MKAGKILILPRPGGEPAGSPPGDDELMRVVASENPEAGLKAFAALVDRHAARVRRYCARFAGSPADGDELAQEVFLDLWRHRGSYAEAGRFTGYLFTLAKNRCRQHVRSRRPAPPPEPAAAGEGDALEALVEQERRRQVQAAIADLSPKLREAVLLRYAAGLEYRQISELLGRPEVTVRSRILLALERLRALLRDGGAR